jgi:hypothetical protein
MTEQQDFLKKLVHTLENVEIPYMVSGSIASSFHGKPRATNDVDIIIAPTEQQLEALAKSFGKDYYINPQTAREALKQNSMFNVVDIQSGCKADFIIRKKRPFSYQEFNRCRDVNMLGLSIRILSPEDVILSKLEWSKDSNSPQQFRDALGVAVVQWEKLDHNYLRKWAVELGINNRLEELLAQVKNLKNPE